MNINVLAKRLGVSQRDLYKLLDQYGIKVRRGSNKLSDRKAKEFVKKVEADRAKREAAIQRAEEARKQALPDEVTVPDVMKVKDLAQRMTVSVNELIQAFMNNGVMATLNDEVDFETIEIVADDFGMKVRKETQTGEQVVQSQGVRKALQEELEAVANDKKTASKLKDRPPVVVVLGHVDHGKTSLLDAIRNTSVTKGESGGITQHIGAYQIEHEGKSITFLDTPGHEAFSAMRERGARVTDVAILVVAADDGVQPQTIEAISFIKNAGVPIVVAINKIDKEGVDPLRVKKELADHDVLTEEWGGKTVCVEISALKGTNIDQLLEMVLLTAEVEELKADPTAPAVGTVIESHVDSGKGTVATILIQNGTLSVGDHVVAGSERGVVRTMETDRGDRLESAGPATPVRMTGLSTPPTVGDIVHGFASKQEAKEKADRVARLQSGGGRKSTVRSESDTRKRLNIAINVDVQGSIEPILEALSKIPTDEALYDVVDVRVGSISESDVLMAASTGAVLYAFHSPVSPSMQLFAKNERVDIVETDVIYELVEHVRARLEAMLPSKVIKKKAGEMELVAVFRTERSKNRMIVGGRVTDGALTNGMQVNIMRGKGEEAEKLGTGEIANMQVNKKNVKELKKGVDGGLQLRSKVRVQEGDRLVAWTEEKEARTLELKA